MKVNQRCRVCGRFLTEARERRENRSSYKCREFADDLHPVIDRQYMHFFNANK